MKSLLKKQFVFVSVMLLLSCSTSNVNVKGITNFEKERYLGHWYEIARLDFKFEKDLNNTSAKYTIADNGLITVVNSGFNYKKGIWKEARGKARFKGADTVGELEVSFFGPFYAAYTIVAIDPNYMYALIAGKNTDYLWILAREKTIPDTVKNEYLRIAQSLGYDIQKLIWVEHTAE